MKLNISPRKSVVGLLFAWAILALYFYAPLTTGVTSFLLHASRPSASLGQQYELELIEKSKFEAKSSVFLNGGFSTEYGIGSDITAQDGRAAALSKYLRDQGSPLTPYASLIVSQADSYGLDWRLVPAISGIESRFCRITPVDTNNCWGWRGGPGGTWQKFEDYGVGIKVLSQRMARGYGIDLTPYDIEPAYCPPCAASGHSWARSVTQFMNGMTSYLDKSRITQ